LLVRKNSLEPFRLAVRSLWSILTMGLSSYFYIGRSRENSLKKYYFPISSMALVNSASES
jgi:hypothetical protein